MRQDRSLAARGPIKNNAGLLNKCRTGEQVGKRGREGAKPPKEPMAVEGSGKPCHFWIPECLGISHHVFFFFLLSWGLL